ncbi:MAG TPA: T9SS type A sorting domain-containing protein [Bacteroidales bacterium]|nr:T9SS type A sorting domain-containing protein [Bacteroidales bacterium]HRZ75782.1 T9SS type A sorting domain-containing protein [Bacteroidales bacterium]
MKRYLPFAAMAAITLSLHAQADRRPGIPERFHKLGVERSLDGRIQTLPQGPRKVLPLMASGLAVTESQIGETRYDQQTNNSLSHRIYYYQDGTTGAVWMRGITDAGGFADRGTGYNYNDGAGWAPMPSARVETLKTGWPGYAPLGESGEIIVTHSATNAGLVISRRSTKGTGNWTQSFLTGPTGWEKLEWPRVVTSGADHNTVHILCMTPPEANQGPLYQGQDGAILYYRSSDGGATWDIQGHYFQELDTTKYVYWGADTYTWAWPKGDTLAFVAANKWNDVVLMKSLDRGLNWTSTVVSVHPYPHFDLNTTYILDTPYVADGATAVALDPQGNAHVFFGLMRVNNDDISDDLYTFFPYTDGLAHWKEGMPAFTTLDFDTLYDQGHLVGFVQDYNGNDTLDYIWGLEGLGEYVVSLSGMPTATIDEEGNIFVLFTSLMENHDNGVQNYRHLLGRASLDGGLNWEDTLIDLTGSLLHNYDECIYPSLSPTSDNAIHYIFMADEEPGLAIDGDEDPYTDNKIIYGRAFKADFGLSAGPELVLPDWTVTPFPNPFSNSLNIELDVMRPGALGLSVRNLLGQEVWTSQTGNLAPGRHTVRMERAGMSPGIYILNVSAGNSVVSRKIIAE